MKAYLLGPIIEGDRDENNLLNGSDHVQDCGRLLLQERPATEQQVPPSTTNTHIQREISCNKDTPPIQE